MEHNPEKPRARRWHTPPRLWDKLGPAIREMRAQPTLEEDLLWQRLRNRQIAGLKFRRQHAIDRFIADFYCAEAKLVVEVDGEVHERTRERDRARTEILEALGFRVLRITNADVRNSIGFVLARISAIATSSSPPAERRSGGEVPGTNE